MYINTGLNFIRLLHDKEIVLFGAGRIGIRTMRRLTMLGLNVKAFLDNDKDKWGKELLGVSIYSLADYMSINNKNKVNDYIVVTVFDSHDILEDLSIKGIFNCADYRQLDIVIGGKDYYDEDYFGWQKKYAEIDSVIDATFFQKFITSKDSIAEFGSGGGFLLDRLICRKKIGIEINPIARDFAKKEFNIGSVESIDNVENETLNVIISTHALEHTTNPYEILCNMHKKLINDGKIIIVVPYEPIDEQYKTDDLSQHLFIWNERVLGNIVKAAGFFVREIGRFGVDYPSEMSDIFFGYGEKIFKELTNIRSIMSNYHSIYVVGEKY